jgi:aminopeptidase-like protein
MNIHSLIKLVPLFPTFQRAHHCEMLADRARDPIRKVYPICRSMTGDGARETLVRMAGVDPLDVKDLLSGTRVPDCDMPHDWRIRGACIAEAAGQPVYFGNDADNASFRS